MTTMVHFIKQFEEVAFNSEEEEIPPPIDAGKPPPRPSGHAPFLAAAEMSTRQWNA